MHTWKMTGHSSNIMKEQVGQVFLLSIKGHIPSQVA
jgi:hypothetical protein